MKEYIERKPIKNKLGGEMQTVDWGGGVFCRRYVGKFHKQSLQDKADVKMWYCRIQGNPFVTGEGHTPEYALRDAIKRAESLKKRLNQGISACDAILNGN